FDRTAAVAGDLDRDVVVLDLADPAHDSAGRDDLITLGERGNHVAVFLLLLHLRTDHEEVQDHEHQDDGQHAHQSVLAASSLRHHGDGDIGKTHRVVQ